MTTHRPWLCTALWNCFYATCRRNTSTSSITSHLQIPRRFLKRGAAKYPRRNAASERPIAAGLYGSGNIVLVVDQMFADCPELFLLLPPVKTYLIARTLYHEIGHHIHRLKQPGYRADKETVADEWRDKLLRDFAKRRYWYFGLLVRGCFKLFPSLRQRSDRPSCESV